MVGPRGRADIQNDKPYRPVKIVDPEQTWNWDGAPWVTIPHAVIAHPVTKEQVAAINAGVRSLYERAALGPHHPKLEEKDGMFVTFGFGSSETHEVIDRPLFESLYRPTEDPGLYRAGQTVGRVTTALTSGMGQNCRLNFNTRSGSEPEAFGRDLVLKLGNNDFVVAHHPAPKLLQTWQV